MGRFIKSLEEKRSLDELFNLGSPSVPYGTNYPACDNGEVGDISPSAILETAIQNDLVRTEDVRDVIDVKEQYNFDNYVQEEYYRYNEDGERGWSAIFFQHKDRTWLVDFDSVGDGLSSSVSFKEAGKTYDRKVNDFSVYFKVLAIVLEVLTHTDLRSVNFTGANPHNRKAYMALANNEKVRRKLNAMGFDVNVNSVGEFEITTDF